MYRIEYPFALGTQHGLDGMPEAAFAAGVRGHPVCDGLHFIYGIRGIEEYFHVSHKTAQEYKNTFLKPAVNQNGRKICVDADLAMQLFNENEAKKHAK